MAHTPTPTSSSSASSSVAGTSASSSSSSHQGYTHQRQGSGFVTTGQQFKGAAQPPSLSTANAPLNNDVSFLSLSAPVLIPISASFLILRRGDATDFREHKKKGHHAVRSIAASFRLQPSSLTFAFSDSTIILISSRRLADHLTATTAAAAAYVQRRFIVCTDARRYE